MCNRVVALHVALLLCQFGCSGEDNPSSDFRVQDFRFGSFDTRPVDQFVFPDFTRPDVRRIPDATPDLAPDLGPDLGPQPDFGPPGTLLVNTFDDFSDFQGTNRLSYGYYDRSDDIANGDDMYSTAEFQLMTQYSDNTWWVRKGSGGGFWTNLSQGAGHPNGLEGNSGRAPAIHWAIRRWRSNYGGTVLISGTLKKAQAGGNGVGFQLLLDGNQLWSTTLAGNDTVGFQFNVCTTIQREQQLDMALTPGDDDNSGGDSTISTLTVHTALPNCGR